VKGIKQAEPQANADGGDAERTTEVAQHFTDEFVEFFLVELRHDVLPRADPGRL
jgi:hypothetical protein